MLSSHVSLVATTKDGSDQQSEVYQQSKEMSEDMLCQADGGAQCLWLHCPR